MASPRISRPNQEARFVKVESDISGLKEDFAALANSVSTSLEKLAVKFEAKTSPNWAAIGVVVMALIAILGWGWALFSSFQSRTDDSIKDLKSAVLSYQTEQKANQAHYITRAEVAERFEQGKEKRDQLQQITMDRMTRIEHDADALELRVVPRNEHQEQWAHQHSIDESIQRQVDELRRAVEGMNSPHDTVQSILQRLQAVEMKTH